MERGEEVNISSPLFLTFQFHFQNVYEETVSIKKKEVSLALGEKVFMTLAVPKKYFSNLFLYWSKSNPSEMTSHDTSQLKA